MTGRQCVCLRMWAQLPHLQQCILTYCGQAKRRDSGTLMVRFLSLLRPVLLFAELQLCALWRGVCGLVWPRDTPASRLSQKSIGQVAVILTMTVLNALHTSSFSWEDTDLRRNDVAVTASATLRWMASSTTWQHGSDRRQHTPTARCAYQWRHSPRCVLGQPRAMRMSPVACLP